MSSWRRWVAVVLLASAVVVGWLPLGAGAHTALVSISPADGATLSEPPTQVRLEISEQVEAALAVVAVTSDAGTDVVLGRPAVDGRVVTQALAPGLSPGTYAVAWKVVSADGHPVSGTSRFVVEAPATPTTDAALVTDTVSPTIDPAAPSLTVTDEPAAEVATAPTGPTVAGVIRLVGFAVVLGGLMILTRRWARRYREAHRE